MVLCPTITVSNPPPPTVTVLERGFAADGRELTTCTNQQIVGKQIQYAIIFSVPYDVIVDLDVTHMGPGGLSGIWHYSNVTLGVGLDGKPKIILISGAVYPYEAGTYSGITVSISNVRAG